MSSNKFLKDLETNIFLFHNPIRFGFLIQYLSVKNNPEAMLMDKFDVLVQKRVKIGIN